jgi:hypothetical protein
VCLLVVVVVMASLSPGHAQKPDRPKAERQSAQADQAPDLPLIRDQGARFNPLKIALLKWYLANRTIFVSIGAGEQPIGLCFDGANIWTANYNGNSVTKVRANDGAVLGTFKVGGELYGVTFDGANIWSSNQADNTVTKMRASDGKVVGTFAAGIFPGWMTFDGENLWIPNSPSSQPGSVTQLRAADGKVVGNFPVGNAPIAAAFDGENVWVVNNGSASVTKLRASDGAILGTFAVGNSPIGIAFDGANIWVANSGQRYDHQDACQRWLRDWYFFGSQRTVRRRVRRHIHLGFRGNFLLCVSGE